MNLTFDRIHDAITYAEQRGLLDYQIRRDGDVFILIASEAQKHDTQQAK